MTAAATVELDGYPFAPKTVEVNGHVMSYVDEGDPDAPPVLLVHGNPTWSFYYRSLLRSLPGLGRRVIAPDHIGMGRSDKPALDDYPHTLARRVEDLTAFVDALGLSRADLAGGARLGRPDRAVLGRRPPRRRRPDRRPQHRRVPAARRPRRCRGCCAPPACRW